MQHNITNLNPQKKLFQTMEDLEKKYTEEEKYTKKGKLRKIMFAHLDLRNPNNLISTITLIVIEAQATQDTKENQKGIKLLNLLSISCVIDIIKKTEGYAELEVFAQSIEAMRTLQETYYDPQKKIGKHKDLQLSTQEKPYFSECFIEVLEILYEFLKEAIRMGYNIKDNIQEAKLALFIANGLNNKEISTLLTEKGVTTEGFYPKFLERLKIFRYNIAEAFISSLKHNIDIPRHRLCQLFNQKTLSLALIEEVKLGNLAMVKALLDHDADPNIKDKFGNTALHEAILKKDLEAIKILLANKGDPNIKDAFGNTPLHRAVFLLKGHLEIIKLLLLNRANPNIQDAAKCTPLHDAAQNGYLEVVKLLLDHGTDPNIQDVYKYTALHEATQNGYLEIVEELLKKKGIKLDLQNRDGKTALHLAAEYGHSEIVLKLLLNNANPNAKDSKGYTPLHLAIFKKHSKTVEMVEKLLANDAELTDEELYTLLQDAVIKAHSGIVKELLAKGIDPNIKDPYGNTLMHFAIGNGNDEYLETMKEIINAILAKLKESFAKALLIKEGRDLATLNQNELKSLLLANENRLEIKEAVKNFLNIQNNNGKTPLHFAAEYGNLEIVLTLLANGANPNIQDGDGYTPLHFAIFKGNSKTLKIVEKLLAHGAELIDEELYILLQDAVIRGYSGIVKELLARGPDLSIQDPYGNTLLHFAIGNGNDDYLQILKELLASGANPNTHNKKGCTPRDLAVANGYFAMVEALDNTTITTDVINTDVINVMIIEGARSIAP